MMKTLLMLLSVCFILFVNGQPLSSSKVVEVTNYKEVLSQIEYPQVCKEKGIEGKVIVSLRVDANGKLMSHKFIAYPCVDIKGAVMEALPKLKFNPAINQHGDAVAGSITMPINFRLTI